MKDLLKSTCSVDIDALYDKYSSRKNNTMIINTSTKKENRKKFNDDNQQSKCMMRNTNKDTSILDDLSICNRCNGLGLMKETYNNQVRDVNCIHCEAEGILWRQSDGSFKRLSERPPKVTTTLEDRNKMTQIDSIPPDLF